MEPETLQIRVHDQDLQPTLIYLPGLHGDWTLVGSFRRAIAGRVRFVEITYPRTLTWSLDDYAAAVEAALRMHDISAGWLLAESFGSQIAWPMVARKTFRVDGVILAGGFVRHPLRRGVHLTERLCGDVSLTLLTRILFGYARLARFRFRHAPETLAGIREFIARRTELDRQAARHRLSLVAQADAREIAREVCVPVYALAGVFDPVVFWLPVCRWLRKNCPGFQTARIIWPADHNVLGTAPETAIDTVLKWMAAGRGCRSAGTFPLSSP